MAEVILFHHVVGLTDGLKEFAESLRAGGHTVHTPDRYDGQVGASIEEGFAIQSAIGKDVVEARVAASVADLPAEVVYAGFSAGGATAQELAQTRPGARGALLYDAFVSLTAEWAFGPWPDGVPVQVHGMDDDEFFAHEGDLAAAQALVDQLGPDQAELFTYPGDGHLFADSSLASYDAGAAVLVVERSLAFLGRVG